MKVLFPVLPKMKDTCTDAARNLDLRGSAPTLFEIGGGGGGGDSKTYLFCLTEATNDSQRQEKVTLFVFDIATGNG